MGSPSSVARVVYGVAVPAVKRTVKQKVTRYDTRTGKPYETEEKADEYRIGTVQLDEKQYREMMDSPVDEKCHLFETADDRINVFGVLVAAGRCRDYRQDAGAVPVVVGDALSEYVRLIERLELSGQLGEPGLLLTTLTHY